MPAVFSANCRITLHKTHAQPCGPKLGCQSVLAQHQMRGFVGSDATVSVNSMILRSTGIRDTRYNTSILSIDFLSIKCYDRAAVDKLSRRLIVEARFPQIPSERCLALYHRWCAALPWMAVGDC
jgi:hypothetical protein